jgi:hypothetical protein
MHRHERRIISVLAMAAVLAAAFPLAQAATEVRHDALQAVDAGGNLAHPLVGADVYDGDGQLIEANRVEVVGIALNDPADMLDLASQWQVAVQGEGDDAGGTFAWAGMFYGQQGIWGDEVARLGGSGFGAGDRIRITGFAGPLQGKANINERHSPVADLDFTVELLEADVGLPTPEPTTLAEMNSFDASRLTGGERYQGRLIRVERVRLKEGVGTWAANARDLVLEDATGGELPLWLGTDPVFDTMAAPAGWFDVIGIGNQEPTGGAPPASWTGGLTDGYSIWVTDPQHIVPEPAGLSLLLLGAASLRRPRCRTRP